MSRVLAFLSPALLIFVALAPHSPLADAEQPCGYRFSKLIRHLENEMQADQLRTFPDKIAKHLQAIGLPVTPFQSFNHRGAPRVPFSTRMVKTGSKDPIPGVDDLFEIHEPASKILSRSLTTPAIQHPAFREILTEIKALKARFVLDPSMILTQTTGSYNPVFRELRISHLTQYISLEHEVEHLHWDHLIRPQFNVLKQAVSKMGYRLKDIATPEMKSHYSEAALDEIEKLMKLGVTEKAIDERMATVRQMELLKLDPWKFQLKWDKESYGLRYIEKDLQTVVQSGSATEEQKKFLQEISARQKKLKLYRNAQDGAIIGGIAVGAGTGIRYMQDWILDD